MQALGIYGEVNIEVGHIIVASVNQDRITELINPDIVASRVMQATMSAIIPKIMGANTPIVRISPFTKLTYTEYITEARLIRAL